MGPSRVMFLVHCAFNHRGKLRGKFGRTSIWTPSARPPDGGFISYVLLSTGVLKNEFADFPTKWGNGFEYIIVLMFIRVSFRPYEPGIKECWFWRCLFLRSFQMAFYTNVWQIQQKRSKYLKILLPEVQRPFFPTCNIACKDMFQTTLTINYNFFLHSSVSNPHRYSDHTTKCAIETTLNKVVYVYPLWSTGFYGWKADLIVYDLR